MPTHIKFTLDTTPSLQIHHEGSHFYDDHIHQHKSTTPMTAFSPRAEVEVTSEGAQTGSG
jgi:hypothetical protein